MRRGRGVRALAHPDPASDLDPGLGLGFERGSAAPSPALLVRAGFGGALMGLANLVPGISGGTMLLAAGIYPAFIDAIAQLTRLRLRVRPLLVLGVVAGCAALAILLFAGPTKTLVVERRWIMYSLFIGLTLGGVPLVWRMARPISPGVVGGALVGLALMIVMALAPGASAGGGAPRTLLLVVSGAAGASAMILPGVSGGYLLLLLGQYVPILSAIDDVKTALLATGGPDLALLGQAAAVVVPVGIGVVVGVVAVSNLIEAALERFPKPTLGALLGLLVGAVFGLWPFQEGVAPVAGDLHDGVPLSAAAAAALPAEDWALRRFAPTPGQVGGSLALILAGVAATSAIARVGSRGGPAGQDTSQTG